MNILPQKLLSFNKSRFINDDPYGKFIFKQVKEWSDLMEEKIPKDSWESQVEFLRKYAEDLSLQTDACENGLTGFQQDCATQILIATWKYRFELWLGLLLYKYDKNYHLSDESIKYVVYYINGDYKSLLEYKKHF